MVNMDFFVINIRDCKVKLEFCEGRVVHVISTLPLTTEKKLSLAGVGRFIPIMGIEFS